MRQTVALEAMLADEARVHAEAERFRAREEREEAEQDSPWLYHGISEDEYAARQEASHREGEVEYLVGRALKQWPRDEREVLELDFREILADRPDLFTGDTPIADIIVSICSDLGIEPDWTALSKKDWEDVDLAIKVALKRQSSDPSSEASAKEEADADMLYGVKLTVPERLTDP